MRPSEIFVFMSARLFSGKKGRNVFSHLDFPSCLSAEVIIKCNLIDDCIKFLPVSRLLLEAFAGFEEITDLDEREREKKGFFSGIHPV